MNYHKIFFSYSRKDADFALKLALDLKKENYDVWIDQEDIRAGSEWDVEIENALVTCDCLLFIQSANSVASNNVLDEVYYALGKNKTVIPVVINNCETPYRLNRLQRVSFIENYNSGLTNLKDNLSSDSFPEITVKNEKKPSGGFNLKYALLALIVVIAIITIIYFIQAKPQSNKIITENIEPATYAGEWTLKNVTPQASEIKGYLKVDTAADGKANIKSSFQFYYTKSNDTAYLKVFNGYVECTSCVVKDSMAFTEKQIDIGAQKYVILKENQANGKRGDTVLNAGLNKSIQAGVTLHIINKDSLMINVVNTNAFITSDGIPIPAFDYLFLFSKEL